MHRIPTRCLCRLFGFIHYYTVLQLLPHFDRSIICPFNHSSPVISTTAKAGQINIFITRVELSISGLRSSFSVLRGIVKANLSLLEFLFWIKFKIQLISVHYVSLYKPQQGIIVVVPCFKVEPDVLSNCLIIKVFDHIVFDAYILILLY